jgi:hypothetical protein
MKKIVFLLVISVFALSVGALFADDASPVPADVEKLKKQVDDLAKRVDAAEKKTVLDRINFTGDFRWEANSINGTIPSYYDGMALQNMVVGAMFYYGSTGQFPGGPGDISSYIASHYGDWLYYANTLTWSQLTAMMAQFPPEMQQALMQMLLPSAYHNGYDYRNSIYYTSRLRLGFKADIAPDWDFAGRLSMYKAWGDSTAVQVFNGQATSMNIDGTTTRVPNSDILRVERAYFTWKNMFNLPMYLSIGRRPSTDGPPLNLRQGELRGGTPMGLTVDYQFDGITWGYHLGDHDTFRLCYGVGFESGFGQAAELKSPADRLKDVHMGGINWDIWSDDSMLVQSTIMRAFDVTDGFNGAVVMPANPITGETVNAPVIMRYSPSANLGDIDLAGVLLQRKDGPLNWFINYAYMKSHPNPVTTPFGGLFSDPFETPKARSGSSVYAGVRYDFNGDNSMLGLEYNHGSKYWFNFAQGADDILAPKLSARGDVFEGYFIHKMHKNVLWKLDYMHYAYDYSGSGWHVGAPKALDATPILGFPTYDKVNVYSLSIITRF